MKRVITGSKKLLGASLALILVTVGATHTGSAQTTGGGASASAPPASTATSTAGEASPGAKPPASGAAPDSSGAATGAGASPAAGAATPVGAAPASPEASPSAESPSPEAPLDGATYRVRLRDLEQKVDELKEQIRRSHTRLSLLSDTILAGASGGARAEIEFQNDLSGAWRLVEAVVVMDGAVQYKKTDDTGVLAAQKTIPIFSGSIPTGDHTVQVLLKLRGHGFGVFSYLRGLEATVRHDHSFTISDGKVIALRAIAWEQGGPTTPLEEQPAIRFSEAIRAMGEAAPQAPATPPSGSSPPAPSTPETTKTPSLDTKASVGGGI